MAKVLKTLSLYDVEYVLNKAGKTIEEFSNEELADALYSVGFQKTGIEIEEDVLHRPMFSPNNTPWNGKRFVGYERQDREWLRCPHATLENVISSQDDTDHQRDLLMMSAQANPTGDILLHIENKLNVSKGENN